MSDKSEDGECSSSPKNSEIVEILDNGGCFVLDRNDDAIEEDVIVLNTSDVQSNEETNGEEDQSTKKNNDKNNWLKSTMASVMSLHEEEPKAEEKKKDNRRKPQCFNCLGEHNMVSCPEPKNHRRIRENRDAFNDARSKESRYTEPQAGQTGEFKPGRLSDNLQRALGIGPNDIPEYIYRMRKMGLAKGYPPGYLKSATVKQTNPDDLLTFHSDNPELKGDAEEANERPLSPTVNSDKVIYYFGFNQTYRALRDRELRFSIPPFNEFVGLLNDHVKKEFWEERKREERKRKASSNDKGDHEGKRARKEEGDDYCMILDAPPPPPIIDMSVVEAKKEEIEEEKEETSLDKSSVVISPGGTPKSRRVSVGTPVLQRKNLGDGMKKVPSLDAFAVGIVPFHVDEPTPRTGFLQKMLKKIKDKLG